MDKDERDVAIMVLVITLAVIIVRIIVFSKYGDLPVTEVPTWALWFMLGSNR